MFTAKPVFGPKPKLERKPVVVLPFEWPASKKIKSYLVGQGFDCAFKKGITLGKLLYKKLDCTKSDQKCWGVDLTIQ